MDWGRGSRAGRSRPGRHRADRTGRRREHERFARAVDRAERVETAPGSPSDEFTTELAVVAALRRLGESVPADEHARARIDERVGVRPAAPAADPVPDSDAGTGTGADTESGTEAGAGVPTAPGKDTARAGRPDRPHRHRVRSRPRPLPVLTAALAAVLSLGGLGVLLSHDALPGDTLYGLKRLREATALGLTLDEEAHAHRRLDYAARRIDELAALSARTPTRVAPAYPDVLADFTEHATEGTTRLTAVATGSGGRQLVSLRDWADRQAHRLDLLGGSLPETAGDGPGALLERIERRATALAARMDCYRITSGSADELGALPATGPCSSAAPPAATDSRGPREPGPSSTHPSARSTPSAPTGHPEPPGPTTSPGPHPTPPSSRGTDASDLVSFTGPAVGADGDLPGQGATPPDVVPAPVPAAPPRKDTPPPSGGDDTPPPSGGEEDPPLMRIPPVLPGLPDVVIG